MKLSEKARDLGLSSKDLAGILKDAGYDFKSPNAILSSEALQFLDIEESLLNKVSLQDAVEQAVVVPTEKGTFLLIKLLVNPNLEVREVERREFDSKVRAYYELNYLVSKYEQGY